MVDIYNHINIDSTKNLVTINTINQNKLYLVYKINTHSLHDIMYYLINVFKYKCNDKKSLADFKFVKNGKQLELLTDPIQSHDNLGISPNINLEFNIEHSSLMPFMTYPNVEYDKTKFVQSEDSTVIFLKNLVGKSMVYNINNTANTTVYELMLNIQEREHIHPDQIRLIFLGRQLEPAKMLSEYNITKQSIIHLVLRLKGGMYNEVSGRNGQYQPIDDVFIDMSNWAN